MKQRALCLLLSASACAAAIAVNASEETLLLEATVNGLETKLVLPVTRRGEDLFVPGQDLRRAGIKVAAPDDEYIRLGAIANTVTIDVATQTIAIEVPLDRLALTSLRFLGFDKGAVPLATPHAATVLNYDLVATRTPGGNVLGGFFEGRWSGAAGVFSSTGLGYAGATTARSVRLDTAYTYTAPDSLRRLRVGDFVGGGLAWTRPVRLGGVQVMTDFNLRPDLVTFPTPVFFGEATVPSTVDLFINGVRELSQPIPPGAFEVRQAPVPTGAGAIAVTVTDPLGRQSLQTIQFYITDRLLAKDLTSFSLDTGFVRLHYGQRSNDYGIGAVVGSVRHGWNDALTLEGHAELTRGLMQSGLGMVASAGHWGVLAASVAASSSAADTGHQVSIGTEHASQGITLSLSRQLASPTYRDLGALSGSPVTRAATNGNLGLDLGRLGSANIAYGAYRLTAGPVGLANPAASVRVLSVSFFKTIVANVNLAVTAFKNFNARGNGITMSVLLPLEGNRTVIAGTNMFSGQHTATLLAVQPTLLPGDMGWQLQATRGDYVQHMAEFDYKGRSGRLTLAASSDGHAYSERAGVRGALAATGQGLFTSGWIDDSFAVVDTGTAPNVSIFVDNQMVGRTRDDGKLLVSNLRSFDVNRISLRMSELPLDANVDAPEQLLKPHDRSASLVDFRVRVGRPARIILTDGNGVLLPAGSAAMKVADGEIAPVGYDGETFFRDVAPDAVLEVTLSSGKKCTSTIKYLPGGNTIALIGPFPCL